MVQVLFFAQLKEQLGESEVAFSGAVPCSMAEVIEHLCAERPERQKYLKAKRLMMACNQDLVAKDHIVNDGDEVAFFPPVTGG